jgi:molybdenum cofactor biosynthesis protein B
MSAGPAATGGTSSAAEHRAAAAQREPVALAVITVSDTRNSETDRSGAFLRAAALDMGHAVPMYTIVPDEPEVIDEVLERALLGQAKVVLLNGGTGIAARDTTVEVVRRRLDKELPGFGELFRMLSFKEVGAAAMLSRSLAGTVGSKLVVALPGSPAAVRLAWQELLAPELDHICWELERQSLDRESQK